MSSTSASRTGSHHVLRDLSFRIPDNTLVNVLGPNGVGKSTLFRCILCLNNTGTGSIRVNGKDLRSISIRERASEIAYIPQSHSSPYDYDVLDVVLMSAGGAIGLFSTPKRMPRRPGVECARARGHRPSGSSPLHADIGRERQLVLIARAIAQNARTIIMDEPTSALDYGNTVRVLSTVRQLAREGLSIVQSTHQPDQAFLYADQTLVIHDGRVLALRKPQGRYHQGAGQHHLRRGRGGQFPIRRQGARVRARTRDRAVNARQRSRRKEDLWRDHRKELVRRRNACWS